MTRAFLEDALKQLDAPPVPPTPGSKVKYAGSGSNYIVLNPYVAESLNRLFAKKTSDCPYIWAVDDSTGSVVYLNLSSIIR